MPATGTLIQAHLDTVTDTLYVSADRADSPAPIPGAPFYPAEESTWGNTCPVPSRLAIHSHNNNHKCCLDSMGPANSAIRCHEDYGHCLNGCMHFLMPTPPYVLRRDKLVIRFDTQALCTTNHVATTYKIPSFTNSRVASGH